MLLSSDLRWSEQGFRLFSYTGAALGKLLPSQIVYPFLKPSAVTC
jgi:hypothetical protein